MGLFSFIFVAQDINLLIFLGFAISNILFLVIFVSSVKSTKRFAIFNNDFSKRRLLVLQILSAFVISLDSNFFWSIDYSWSEARLASGYLTSVSLMIAYLIAGRVVTYKITDPYLYISVLILLIIVYFTGSRLIAFSFLVAFLLYNSKHIVNNLGLLLSSLMLMLAFPVLLRYLRDGNIDIKSFSSIFAGELDVFNYIHGAKQISSDYLYFGQSYFYNLLSVFGPFRRDLFGKSFQERLWDYHYGINHLGLANDSSNKVLVDIGGYGSHHPTYVYEYYDYFGYLGSIFAIPYFVFLFYLFIKFIPYSLRSGGFLNVITISTALFLVRGNSVGAFSNLIVAIVAAYILYVFLIGFRK